MCEYCRNDWINRNTYDFYTEEQFPVKGSIEINSNDLLFKAKWRQETDPGHYEDMGMAARFMIRYCPWCGRKLEEENASN